jgi:hypothetical protein
VGSAAGKINNAASFDGVLYGGSWLTSGHRYSLSANGFSVSTWVNGTTTNVGPAVSQWQTGKGFIVGVDSDYAGTDVFSFVLGNYPTNETNFTATYPYSAGWHHIVGTYDPTIGTSKLYVDGVLRNTVTDIPSITLDGSANFKMGTIDSGGEFVYSGLVDSTGLWTRPLTDAEIVALYNNGSGLPYNQF